MTANGVLQLVFYVVVLLVAAWPLGIFMARVYEGKPHFLSWLGGLERGLYRLAGVDPAGEMTWRQYAIAMLAFNLLGLVFLYGLQRIQHLLPLNPAADAIALVGLLAVARFFIALAGMDVGTAFGSLGARREMMVGFLAEPALLMVLFTASLISHSSSLTTIVETLAHREFVIYPSMAFAGVAFTMVSLAENARIPVDNPATHLELTMVHEAMILEYSGRHLAVIELASFVKLLLYVSIIACVFLPWGIAVSGQGFAAYLVGLAAYLVKLAAGGFLLAVFETAMAKMRVFRVSDFLGAALMLGLLATLLLFVSRVT